MFWLLLTPSPSANGMRCSMRKRTHQTTEACLLPGLRKEVREGRMRPLAEIVGEP